MKKTTLFSLIGIFIIGVSMTMGGCKKKDTHDEWVPPAYKPSFIAQGFEYTSSGYSFLYFELKCTSDAVEITSIMVAGPFGTVTFSGGGEIFNQNQSIYLYDEDKFLYACGKWDFTIKGYIRSGSHTGESFTQTTRYELL
ncbi:MAG: hypothetical protein ISS17_00660 [Bacteroidales bacterium]|nr:hypothetical protein [Deltaproteobacteria bacterium]MBL7137270.1 hypothetical protein [Bacteroidales bacterium]